MPSDLQIYTECGAPDALADVIFLHGLAGDPKATWTATECEEELGGFWPLWICHDLKLVQCHMVGYPASIFEQWAKKEMGLFERAKSVLDLLTSHGFGNRPIILIAHSLGGLLVKQLIVTGTLSGNESWRAVVERIRLVVFLGTPHTGASLATVFKFVFPRLSSPHVAALSEEEPRLLELNDAYRAHAASRSVKTVAYYEKFKAKNSFIIVDSASADPGIAGCCAIPVDADHSSLCKPRSRTMPVYLGVLNHIRAVLPENPDRADDHSVRSPADRRDLLQKLVDANREHEYAKANELQNAFAREYCRLGLHTPARHQRDRLLQEVEQRFLLHVYQPLICTAAPNESVLEAVQSKVIDPLAGRTKDAYDHKTVMQAIYYLTEQCFISWNPQ